MRFFAVLLAALLAACGPFSSRSPLGVRIAWDDGIKPVSAAAVDEIAAAAVNDLFNSAPGKYDPDRLADHIAKLRVKFTAPPILCADGDDGYCGGLYSFGTAYVHFNAPCIAYGKLWHEVVHHLLFWEHLNGDPNHSSPVWAHEANRRLTLIGRLCK